MLAAMVVLQYLWSISFTMCRHGFSTVEHFHAISHLNEKTSEYTVPTYVALIDYDETYDCVSQQYVYKSGGKSSPIKYRNLIEYLYASDKNGMVFNRNGKYFRNKRKVKRNDPLSPALFSYILEEVFKSSNWKNKKCGILMEQNGLTYLWFPDDLIIFASNRRTLLSIVSDLQREAKYAGLAINQQILMTYSEQVEMHLKKKPLIYKEETVYLGELIAYNKRNGKVLNRKVSLTWKNFWAFKFGLRNRMRSMEKVGSRMNVEVTSCLVEGCELWSMSSEIIQKLAGCRNIVSWKWEGHVIFITDKQWSEILTHWTPYLGRKKKWRQRSRWDNDMAKARRDWYGLENEKGKCKKEEKEKKDETELE